MASRVCMTLNGHPEVIYTVLCNKKFANNSWRVRNISQVTPGAKHSWPRKGHKQFAKSRVLTSMGKILHSSLYLLSENRTWPKSGAFRVHVLSSPSPAPPPLRTSSCMTLFVCTYWPWRGYQLRESASHASLMALGRAYVRTYVCKHT